MYTYSKHVYKFSRSDILLFSFSWFCTKVYVPLTDTSMSSACVMPWSGNHEKPWVCILKTILYYYNITICGSMNQSWVRPVPARLPSPLLSFFVCHSYLWKITLETMTEQRATSGRCTLSASFLTLPSFLLSVLKSRSSSLQRLITFNLSS